MANMGYCRFQNTARDLEDCVDHIGDELSDDEHEARVDIVKMAARIMCEIGLLAYADIDVAINVAENMARDSEAA